MTSLTGAFRQHLTACGRASGTIERYCATIASLLTAHGLADDETTSLMALTPSDIGRFLDGAHSGPQRNVHLSALRTFFTWLEALGQVTRNPAATAPRAKVTANTREPPSLSDTLKLVATVENTAPRKLKLRDVAIIQLFFHTALRVTEVVSIDINQVDLEHGLIRNVVTKGDGRLTVIINDVVAEALERYLAARANLGPEDDDRALFLSQRGTRIAVRSVEEFVRGYAERAGLPVKVTPHVLRHASATELIEFTDIRTVQEHLGHKSVTTTQRYTHVKESKRRMAVDELGRRWRRAASGNFRRAA
jgi:site-specific recombinase XerD